MQKNILWSSILFLIVLLLACNDSGGLATGREAPDFSIDIHGERRSVSDYRDHVLVIGFWASTCGPCREELPVLNELAHDYAGQGVTIWAINVGDDREVFRAFVRSVQYDHLIWVHDEQGEIQKLYRVRAIPALYLIDEQGTIRYVQIGYGSGTQDKIRSELDALLNP